MSYSNTIGLAKKILAAEKRVAWYWQCVLREDTLANQIELAMAQAYLGGLCAAMAIAANHASIELQSSLPNVRARMQESVREMERGK